MVFHLAAISAVAIQTLFLMILGITGEEILYGYGPLGVITVLLLAFARSTIDRLVKDRDSAVAQRDAMVKDMFTEALPVMQRTITVLEKREQLDVEIVAVLRDVRRALERL